MTDIVVYRARFTAFVSPHICEEFVAGEDFAGIFEGILQKFEFFAREGEFLSVQTDEHFFAVHIDIARLDYGVVACHSAEHGGDFGGKFEYAERFGDIVVGSEIEPRHFIRLLAERGEHYAVDFGVAFLEARHNLQSVAVAEHYVHDGNAGKPVRDSRFELRNRAECETFDVVELQGAFHQLADSVVVFQKINKFFHTRLVKNISRMGRRFKAFSEFGVRRIPPSARCS